MPAGTGDSSCDSTAAPASTVLVGGKPSAATLAPLTCSICYEPSTSYSALACGHPFCNTCYSDFLSHKITDEGHECFFARCPEHKCQVVVSAVLVRSLVHDGGQLHRYEQAASLARTYVDDQANIKWCPAPDCGHAVRSKHPAALKATGRPIGVQCSCAHRFCFSCMQDDHSPSSCAELHQWTIKCRDDSETYNWLVANTKPCPKCQTSIEKNGGCNHMTVRPAAIRVLPQCCQAAQPHPASTRPRGTDEHSPRTLHPESMQTHPDPTRSPPAYRPRLSRPPTAPDCPAQCKNTSCKYEFCWVCVGPWKDHSGSYYNCNKYDPEKDKDTVDGKKKDSSRAALERYLHYYTRFTNHHNSLKFEIEARGKMEAKIKEMEALGSNTWMDCQYLNEANEALYQCRYKLKFTYVFAFYLPRDDNFRHQFEMQQTELERQTEELAELLERDVAEIQRMEVVHCYKMALHRLKNLDELVAAQTSEGAAGYAQKADSSGGGSSSSDPITVG